MKLALIVFQLLILEVILKYFHSFKTRNFQIKKIKHAGIKIKADFLWKVTFIITQLEREK